MAYKNEDSIVIHLEGNNDPKLMKIVEEYDKANLIYKFFSSIEKKMKKDIQTETLQKTGGEIGASSYFGRFKVISSTINRTSPDKCKAFLDKLDIDFNRFRTQRSSLILGNTAEDGRSGYIRAYQAANEAKNVNKDFGELLNYIYNSPNKERSFEIVWGLRKTSLEILKDLKDKVKNSVLDRIEDSEINPQNEDNYKVLFGKNNQLDKVTSNPFDPKLAINYLLSIYGEDNIGKNKNKNKEKEKDNDSSKENFSIEKQKELDEKIDKVKQAESLRLTLYSLRMSVTKEPEDINKPNPYKIYNVSDKEINLINDVFSESISYSGKSSIIKTEPEEFRNQLSNPRLLSKFDNIYNSEYEKLSLIDNKVFIPEFVKESSPLMRVDAPRASHDENKIFLDNIQEITKEQNDYLRKHIYPSIDIDDISVIDESVKRQTGYIIVDEEPNYNNDDDNIDLDEFLNNNNNYISNIETMENKSNIPKMTEFENSGGNFISYIQLLKRGVSNFEQQPNSQRIEAALGTYKSEGESKIVIDMENAAKELNEEKKNAKKKTKKNSLSL